MQSSEISKVIHPFQTTLWIISVHRQKFGFIGGSANDPLIAAVEISTPATSSVSPSLCMEIIRFRRNDLL